MTWSSFARAHLAGFALAMLTVGPATLVVELLRTWNVSSVLVLMAATASIVPCILVICSRPGLFLGQDGQWMFHKLMSVLLKTSPAEAVDSSSGIAEIPATAGLPLVALGRRLAAEGVRCCRWKARANLQRMLSGEGDVDLLVDRHDVAPFLRAAEETGFRRVIPCFESSAAKEIHLYGLDQETGALLHVHVNVTLLGAVDIAAALERVVFQNCTPGPVDGPLAAIPVALPAAELLVFVLQAMERYAKWRELPRLVVSSARLTKKLQVVLATDAQSGWQCLLQHWLPENVCSTFGEFMAALQQPASWWRRHRLARQLRRQLANALSKVDSHEERLTQEELEGGPASPLVGLFKALWWRLVHGSGSPKQLPGGGKVISFIGPDASGKSTMVAASADWLGKVFRIKVAHLGKPPSTWLTLLPNTAGRWLGRVAPRMRTFHQRPAQAGSSARGQGLLYRIRAVLLAYDRRALARRLARQASQGWLVICDRYPTACVGAPDSARLRLPQDEPGLSWLRAGLARMESRLYQAIPNPAIVVRLSAPVDLALDRNRQRDKPGKEGDDFVARRHNDFFMPPFPGAQIVELDTSTSRDSSVQTMRRQLWQELWWPGQSRSKPPTPPSRPPGTEVPEDALNRPHLNGVPPSPIALHREKSTLVVEFIGVTGAGKSTLIAAVLRSLASHGVRAELAEQVILSRHRLAWAGTGKLSSALVLALSLVPFGGYFLTRRGSRLSRLGCYCIAQGMNNVWVGAHLLRNFVKRVGSHLLLKELLDETSDCDLVIWDEGPVHAAHNLFVHGGVQPKADQIMEFGGLVPRPDLLVWVTAPTAQSAKVVLQRGHSRVVPTGPAAQTFAEHGQRTFEVLSSVPALKEMIYRFDNSAQSNGHLDETVAARASMLSDFLVEQLQQANALPPRRGATLCLTA
jgi:thymidylate kinase